MNEFKLNRVLVTGANGQLARAIIEQAPGATECIGITRAQLDIADREQVARALEESQPELVINGAAYNLVDKAETDGMNDALRVNALGVAALAEACKKRDVPLLHFSTDFVFDGTKRTPYTEDDAARPLGVYAASKLCGENIALAASPETTRFVSVVYTARFRPMFPHRNRRQFSFADAETGTRARQSARC
jgi:dTDP-4-dehydrorhamnose reductase